MIISRPQKQVKLQYSKHIFCCDAELNLKYLAIDNEMLYYEAKIPGGTYYRKSAAIVLFFLNKYTPGGGASPKDENGFHPSEIFGLISLSILMMHITEVISRVISKP